MNASVVCFFPRDALCVSKRLPKSPQQEVDNIIEDPEISEESEESKLDLAVMPWNLCN